jgi:hypothetical protein
MPVFEYAGLSIVRFHRGTMEVSGKVYFQLGGVGHSMDVFCVAPASVGTPTLTIDFVRAMEVFAKHCEEQFAAKAYRVDPTVVIEKAL